MTTKSSLIIILIIAFCRCGHAEFEIRTSNKTQPPTQIPPSSEPSINNEPVITPKLTWFDTTRQNTKQFLNQTAGQIDYFFGIPDPKKPATASLRFTTDIYYNQDNGVSIKPKLRARIRLPSIQNRLSVMVGSDQLEYTEIVGFQNQLEQKQQSQYEQYEIPAASNTLKKHFDKKLSRDENTSLSLRFSRWKERQGIYTDADIGVRFGGEVFIRLRAEKNWQNLLTKYPDIQAQFVNNYRYGTKSKHYLHSNFQLNRELSKNSSLIHNTYLSYQKNQTRSFYLGHQFYHSQTFHSHLGTKNLSYGLQITSDIAHKKAFSSYGAFINYRQPIFRDWLFIQSETSYYNNKVENKKHTLASLFRLEMVF